MKLIFKGYLKDYSQLPKGELPSDAVKFREPKTKVQAFAVHSYWFVPQA